MPKNIDLLKMNLKDFKLNLKKIKDDNKYDYEFNISFYKVFTSLNEKKKTIDFLFEKKDNNIDNLKDKLNPSIKNWSVKDIEDAIECLNHYKNLKNLNGLKIIEFLKYLELETIFYWKLEGNCKILGIMRYILNKVYSEDKIKDSEIYYIIWK